MSLCLVQGTAQHLPLANASIDCCVTSPPYWGLRVYSGLVPEVWPGGSYAPLPGAAPVHMPAQTVCLGAEETPESFVWHLIIVLRELRRVLRDTGTLWLNLGDSYSSGD